ncbi:MAG: LysM domain-containing protein [Patescibacteria group bacterium]
MANWNQKFNQTLTSVKQKPANFLLGLIVLIILVITISFSFQGTPTESEDGTKKSALTKIKELFTGQDEEEVMESNIYVVKEGDHLWKIAEEAYGSGYNAYDIALANDIVNPSLIEVGQELNLPELEPKEATVSGEDTEEMSQQPKQYTVVKGDHLWSIAQKVYNDPYKWSAIAQTNSIVNPNYIEVGQVLNLP